MNLDHKVAHAMELHYERGFIDGMQKQMQSSVDKAVNRMAQTQEQRTEQEPFEDLATELFVIAQTSPADDGFSDTIERIELWLREHFSTSPQRKPLTVQEIDSLREANSEGRGAGWRFNFKGFARAIEAAHGIKENT